MRWIHSGLRGAEDGDLESTRLVPPVGIGLVVGVASFSSLATVLLLQFLLGLAGARGATTVPVLVGLPEERARLLAEGAKLPLAVTGSAPDPVVARGAVTRQLPLAGARVPAGTRVEVTISQGPPSFALPTLHGLPLAQAQERLDRLGLQRGEVRLQAQLGLVDGTVITTTPLPGSSVTPGSQVSLIVARSRTGAQGKAERPAPATNQAAPAATRAVSAAGPLITVPKVIGIRLQFATSRLAAAGLAVGRVSYRRDEDHMETMVLGQTPTGGSAAPRGSTVDLVVNRLE